MSFATIVDRVRADFVEMPGLELNLPQAVRLWNVGLDDCRHVLDALIDAGFLKWTAKRTIIRTGRNLTIGLEPGASHVSVRRPLGADKSVG